MNKVSPLILVVLFGQLVTAQNKLKVCSIQKPKLCEQLERNDFLCQDVVHKIDCAIDMDLGLADFGSITAEEALVASPFVSNIAVVGEIRSTEKLYENTDYQTVVIVKKDVPSGFASLKGKNYCHPGFDMKMVTNYVLNEFEEIAMIKQDLQLCPDKEDTMLIEKYYQNLDLLFGGSCRPGQWSAEKETDFDLKMKYSKLNKLCPSEEHGGFDKSLNCLLESGDVAVTSLDSVNKFLKGKENDTVNFQFLCKNGSTSDIKNPCVWTKQPWSLIVANTKHVGEVREKLKTVMKNAIFDPSTNETESRSVDISDVLQEILFEKNYKIVMLNDSKPLAEYIKEFREIPKVDTDCFKMKWCTTSDLEQQKCKWAAQASANQGIKPIIDCKQTISKLDCINEIASKNSDVVNIEDYGFVAQRRKLEGLSYPETSHDYLAKYITVVKTSNDQIKSFHDLKDKRGCFSEFGRNAWLSLIDLLIEDKIVPKDSCDYGKIASTFFGDSCMPGARDEFHAPTTETDEDKVCKLCSPYPNGTAHTCNADISNAYFGKERALLCLKERGDFAVVKIANFSADIDPSEFRVICRNGSLALYPGFEVDDACAMTIVTDSEVVTRRNDPKYHDYSLAFIEFEDKLRLFTPFEMFNVFNRTKNLLFPDSTAGLVTANSSNIYVQNYRKLFDHLEQCSVDGKDGSSVLSSSMSLWLATLTVLVLAFIM